MPSVPIGGPKNLVSRWKPATYIASGIKAKNRWHPNCRDPEDRLSKTVSPEACWS